MILGLVGVVVVGVVQARKHLAFRRPRVAPRNQPVCSTSPSTAWWVGYMCECGRERKGDRSGIDVVRGKKVYRDQLRGSGIKD